jgi:ribonuclease III
MDDLTVVFRCASDIEARVVRGLLESHGIESLLSSGLSHSIFPVAVDGNADIRISVRAEDAEEAQRLIESHRTEVPGGRVIPLRKEFAELQDQVGYQFRDAGLLEHALTHTSRANEDVSGGVFDNESLEFLGDAVLGFAIADLLFRRFPDRDEGWKSKIKASLVSTSSLAKLAEGLNLGDHLLLGRGEEKTGGRRKQALLADGYEALIAAVYLDGGIDQATAFIARQFTPLIPLIPLISDVRTPAAAVFRDFKSALQERVQSAGDPPPDYAVIGETGPDHHKVFQVEVRISGRAVAAASGRSKKEAEQEAARLALKKLPSEIADDQKI